MGTRTINVSGIALTRTLVETREVNDAGRWVRYPVYTWAAFVHGTVVSTSHVIHFDSERAAVLAATKFRDEGGAQGVARWLQWLRKPRPLSQRDAILKYVIR